MNVRWFCVNEVVAELEGELLKDRHFAAGNEWLTSKGTPARTPFDFLIDQSHLLHTRYRWWNSRLRVRVLSQMEHQ